jgi:6-phosphogluconolactonase
VSARKTPELIVGTPTELAAVFADRVVGLALRAQAEGRTLSIALPGGSVAEAFFPTFAQAPIDWNAIDWFWGDERAVPPDHADSNYRLAAELLFQHVPVDPARIHRMRAEGPDLDIAASEYEQTLMATCGVPPRLDVVLLGVGPDGHVCSLFPGHPGLDESSSFVIGVTDAPKPPPHRMTLTLPALADAVVVVGAFGASKAFPIYEALEHHDTKLPVALVAQQARHALFLADRDAAGRVRPATPPAAR